MSRSDPARPRPAALALALLLAGLPLAGAMPAAAQGLDMNQGGPVDITSTDGIEWRQADQVVIARGNARAIRQGVTLNADRLLARYRNRGQAAGGQAAGSQPAGQAGGQPAQPAGAAQGAAQGTPGETPLSGNAEIWRLEAEGNVRIASATDTARGDRAVYDLDQAVMVLTGRDLSLTTPQQHLTARDSLEYWPQRRIAVARGKAVVVTSDNRRIAADTLVGYFLDQSAPAAPGARPAPGQPAAGAQQPAGAQPAQEARATLAAGGPVTPPARPAASPIPGLEGGEGGGRIEKVEAFGNVEIRTETDVVRGDRGVYSPVTGMARLLGNVRITRGDNQLNGTEAIVNLRTGVARLVSTPGQRVQGLVVPQQGAGEDPLARGGSQPRPGGGRAGAGATGTSGAPR
ncbi:hypothetical protein M0638_09890 [Roseomonas sp. NAR14]|uniref:Organic solvent tolerance-like N-terminal domain-containing protein n=1 Tax=Roseomonas acroporae TaxID=2937791 RepID=A0A9X2BV44_9PROT|nr:LptA/OstA family protein [Roseomonas acroporae]MCK8784691.1 hypothetical protein [Roseomonas acroporae]